MAFRRFTMTFFPDIDSAPRERQTLTIIGSISGVRPTATATAKKNASFQSCLVRPLMTNTSGTITAMKPIMSQVKWVTPRSKLVSTGSPVSVLAMVPRYVRGPVSTTTAVAVPLSTAVPRKQRLRNSSARLVADLAGGLELLDRQGLAGQARLRDEEVATGEDTDVGRDHVPRAQAHDVAGDESRERLLDGSAVAQDRRRHPDHRAQALRRGIRAGLLKEAQADAQHDHHRHDDGRADVAGEERDGGEQRQEKHQGVEARAHEQPEARVAFVVRHHVRPVPGESTLDFVFREPLERAPEPRQGRRRARPRRSPRARGDALIARGLGLRSAVNVPGQHARECRVVARKRKAGASDGAEQARRGWPLPSSAGLRYCIGAVGPRSTRDKTMGGRDAV